MKTHFFFLQFSNDLVVESINTSAVFSRRLEPTDNCMSPILPISTWYFILAVGIISYILNCWIKISKNKNLSLPPGPKGYPVIGNVYQTPQRYPWLAYAEWKEKYGSVSSFTVMGKTTIVLNSLKAAQDLLDHRSSNFSSRPRMVCDSPSFIVVLDHGSS